MDIHGRYHSSDRNGGEAAAPPFLWLLSYPAPVYALHASLFVWRARVVLFCVARVCCALLSAAPASARPGSAPAGKPPAKRLGKHRASRPSDLNGFAKKTTLFRRRILNQKCCFFDKKDALKPISGPQARCKDSGRSILSSRTVL